MTVQTTNSNPVLFVDEPGPNTTRARPFTVSGWAIDRGAATGTGIESELTIRQIVKLYAALYGVTLSGSQIVETLKSVGLARRRPSATASSQADSSSGWHSWSPRSTSPPLGAARDEPTAGLDPQARRQLWSHIEQIRAEGRSILLTTHSMEEAQAVCNRVAIIDHGKILTVETPAGLIEKHKDDLEVRRVARGQVTLEDVFIGLTGQDLRD